MKKAFFIVLLLFGSTVFGQTYLSDFSSVSRSISSNISHLAKISYGYVISIKQSNISKLYSIDVNGVVLDSVTFQPHHTGIPVVDESGKLYFLCLYSEKGLPFSQRYRVYEFDDNFNIVRQLDYPIFEDHIKGVLGFYVIDLSIVGLSCTFTIYQDTFYTAGFYISDHIQGGIFSHFH